MTRVKAKTWTKNKCSAFYSTKSKPNCSLFVLSSFTWAMSRKLTFGVIRLVWDDLVLYYPAPLQKASRLTQSCLHITDYSSRSAGWWPIVVLIAPPHCTHSCALTRASNGPNRLAVCQSRGLCGSVTNLPGKTQTICSAQAWAGTQGVNTGV